MKRYYNSFFNKIKIVAFVSLCLLMPVATTQAQSNAKAKSGTFEITIVDENNNPVDGVNVTVGENLQQLKTDKNGNVSLNVKLSEQIKISFIGYATRFFTAGELKKNPILILQKEKMYVSENDYIELPFAKIHKRNFVDNVKIISSEELEKYPTIDFRNSLTGLMPGLQVTENYGITGMSAEEILSRFGVRGKASLRVRGLSPIFIIDNIPTAITEMQLVPEEIESVTLLNGIVAKTMYGPQAANGALLIKTKRGKRNERQVMANVEYGVSSVDRFPEFVSGADYARLNNIARKNSELPTLYDDNAIAGYEKNNPYDIQYPSVNFRDMIFKDSKPITRINLSSKGGNNIVQYFANLSYNKEDDLYKIGGESGYSRLTARSNLDVKINDEWKAELDFYGGLTQLKSPTAYSGKFALYEIDKILSDVNTISPIAFPIYVKNEPEMDSPWYGVTNVFKRNPIGEMLNGGYYAESGRIGNVSFALEYDMKRLLPGLKSKTFVGFQTYNQLRIGKNENYIAYYFDPALSVDDMKKAHDGEDKSSESKLGNYYYQRFGVFQRFSYDKSFGKHAINTGLTYNISRTSIQNIKEPKRFMNTVLNGLYTYDNKYSVQAVLNHSGTYSFDTSNRYAISGAAGLGWVISEESFMKPIKFIDYWKLNLQAGVLAYDGTFRPNSYKGYWYYATNVGKFGPGPTDQWFGKNEDKDGYNTSISRIANPNLTWEKRKEMSIGTDLLMCDKRLALNMTYYRNVRDGIIAFMSNTTPFTSGLGSAIFYQNFEKQLRYGLETSLQYSDNVGDFGYSFGASINYLNSKVLKADEPNYRDAYQKKEGKPVDAMWGLTYLGKFNSKEEIDAHPRQMFSPDLLDAGDLKYADLNEDGVVDENDKTQIGNYSPRLFYSTNLHLNYKNVELTVVGTGRAFYDISMSNRYFWNGWGDNTYSKFVKDNVSGAYPRLTYEQVTNNFQSSQFWLKKGNFFKIQNVELAYTLPKNISKVLRTKGVRLYVRGANLLTLSSIKDVDPENINSGIYSAPLFKTYTIGAKITF